MKITKKNAPITLAKGQLWKIDDAIIEIVALGKSLTHYRRLRSVNQKGAPTRLEKIGTVLDYLQSKKATLVSRT